MDGGRAPSGAFGDAWLVENGGFSITSMPRRWNTTPVASACGPPLVPGRVGVVIPSVGRGCFIVSVWIGKVDLLEFLFDEEIAMVVVLFNELPFCRHPLGHDTVIEMAGQVPV